MLKTQRWILVLTVAATLVVATTPRNASACGLFNWLFPRRNAAATTAYRPLWTAPTYTTNYAPTSCCQPACNTCVQAETTVQYVPETAYRTSYNRTPVTVYRPATQTDPCTGCPVTVMQPCTTWSWQAQRVPYTTYRPVYQTVQRPVTSCCSPVAATTTYAAPAVASPGCSSCSAAPAISYPSAPSYPAMPSYPSQPSQQVYPAQPQGQFNGGTPADSRPTLVPGQGSQQQQLQRVPADNNATYNYNNNAPQQQAYPPAQQQQQPNSSTRYRLDSNLQPVPDPDSSSNSGGDHMRANSAPRLLNPLDRAALMPVRRASLSTPIAWPATAPAAVRPAASHTEPVLDDSGWGPVGR